MKKRQWPKIVGAIAAGSGAFVTVAMTGWNGVTGYTDEKVGDARDYADAVVTAHVAEPLAHPGAMAVLTRIDGTLTDLAANQAKMATEQAVQKAVLERCEVTITKIADKQR